MTAVANYLASGGIDYLMSPIYEARRQRLGKMMAGGPISLADAAATLGLPIGVLAELWNVWQAERATAAMVVH